MPGPPPKRDAARRRRNKDVETIKIDLGESLSQVVEIPAPPKRYFDKETGEELDEPEEMWHPVARDWYMSLTKSGQAIFYEPSDWSTAYLVAEQINQHFTPRPVQTGSDGEGNPTFTFMIVPMPGAALNAILKAGSSLMTTEGERRRLKIELDRQKIRDGVAEGGGKVIPITAERQNRFRKA